jgi:hypothetical protein
MDFVYGGVTLDHVRQTLLEFLDLRSQAEDVIYPPPNSTAVPAKK